MPKRKIKHSAKPPVHATAEALSAMQSVLTKQIGNAVKQIEAYIGIQHYLNTGRVLPSFHGWPISPDLGHFLIGCIESQSYDLIIEFGSGVSTWVIAQVRKNKTFKHLAFDHLPEFFEKTKQQLSADGLIAEVDLRLTPLIPWVGPDQVVYPYYDCDSALSEHAVLLNQAGKRLLVLIDGPPASTGRHARYPAMAHVLRHFPLADVDFLMDDYIRLDEQEILQRWVSELDQNHVNYQKEIIRMEKDIAILSVTK
jgi:hypothetical protein